jgi:hypothetical protein
MTQKKHLSWIVICVLLYALASKDNDTMVLTFYYFFVSIPCIVMVETVCRYLSIIKNVLGLIKDATPGGSHTEMWYLHTHIWYVTINEQKRLLLLRHVDN